MIDAIDAASINTQMMANITTGAMTVEEAVKDAHDKIVQIFEEGGVPNPNRLIDEVGGSSLFHVARFALLSCART